MVLLHVDTDFGGDPDDACALAMLLGWPDVEITGITTNLERAGQRAGCVQHYLALAGRSDIAVAAGAETTLTTGEQFASTWGDPRYWPDDVAPMPSSPDADLVLLEDSIRRGATIVAIGALTNLARLELARPGALHDVDVVAMAGWLGAPSDGLPDWGPGDDFNLQSDTRAAEVVIAAAQVTLVTLPVAMHSQLRRRDLPRLRASGPIGALLARQSELYASETGKRELGLAYPGLADDLVNFHWDPVAAAVAAGWSPTSIEDVTLATQVQDGVLTLQPSADGRKLRAVVDIDADEFTRTWLAAVEAADRDAATRAAGLGSDARRAGRGDR